MWGVQTKLWNFPLKGAGLFVWITFWQLIFSNFLSGGPSPALIIVRTLPRTVVSRFDISSYIHPNVYNSNDTCPVSQCPVHHSREDSELWELGVDWKEDWSVRVDTPALINCLLPQWRYFSFIDDSGFLAPRSDSMSLKQTEKM